jgi:hypothetical protein
MPMEHEDFELELKLLKRQLSELTDEVLEQRRRSRQRLDDLRLDLEALKLCLADAYRGKFSEKFAVKRDQARYEISPE